MAKDPWDKFHGHSDSNHLVHAVIVVFERYRAEGKKPGAEKWATDTERYRADMVLDVLVQWATYVGTDSYFPFQPSYVARAWVLWRKTSKAMKARLCDFYGVEFSSSHEEDLEDDDLP